MKKLILILLLSSLILTITGCSAFKTTAQKVIKFPACIAAFVTCFEASGGNMDSMKDTAEMISYINLLAPQYGLEIDWDESDVNKKQLSFKGDTTDAMIQGFCLALHEYCDKKLEE